MSEKKTMTERLILELEGNQYDLDIKDIAVYVGENYITFWTDGRNSFDIPLKGAKDEAK